MDEKEIGRTIVHNFKGVQPNVQSVTLCAAIAAAELAQLFEREMAEREGRVLWEGEGTILIEKVGHPNSAYYTHIDCDEEHIIQLLGKLCEDGQHVKVVVYDQTPEKSPEIEKAQEGRGDG